MLVICPASLCANWRAELTKWLGLAGVGRAEAFIKLVRNGRDELQADGAWAVGSGGGGMGRNSEGGRDAITIISYAEIAVYL